MMTLEMMVAQVEALGHDAFYSYDEADHSLDITIHDLDGFDADWQEVMREFDDAEAVRAFEQMLEDEALESFGDFYTYYTFEGFEVCLGYSSFDV